MKIEDEGSYYTLELHKEDLKLFSKLFKRHGATIIRIPVGK